MILLLFVGYVGCDFGVWPFQNLGFSQRGTDSRARDDPWSFSQKNDPSGALFCTALQPISVDVTLKAAMK
ncbi:hypothetical protein [Zhihengliuella halotolerans]|uniref:hypothetical protein n=1 Tax=Zhihengliuella halotolerans TaxID=370736 RepID=UPI0013EE94E3|nr:hypothetical protein [Zhihengliuella halotolerans]